MCIGDPVCSVPSPLSFVVMPDNLLADGPRCLSEDDEGVGPEIDMSHE